MVLLLTASPVLLLTALFALVVGAAFATFQAFRWRARATRAAADARLRDAEAADLHDKIEDLRVQLAYRDRDIAQLEEQNAELKRQVRAINRAEILEQTRADRTRGPVPPQPEHAAPASEDAAPFEPEPSEDALWTDDPAWTHTVVVVEATAPAKPGADWSSFPAAPAPEEADADDLDDVIQWTSLPARPARDAGGDGQPWPDHDGLPVSGTDTETLPAPPEGGDDLTLLTGLDAEARARLHALGVTTFDEVARWNLKDAQHFAALLPGVSEDLILSTWVYEAQSYLFDRYQQDLRSRRGAGGA